MDGKGHWGWGLSGKMCFGFPRSEQASYALGGGQHLGGFTGHSLPEQSAGRNRPIGGHGAEEPSELIKQSINKDHKATRRRGK